MILTRGHRYDQICLEKIAAKEHAYIGMIGSRRRTALVKQSLAEKGVDQEVLDAVYTPIGLDIGAQTPAEIGVAIIAEIIEVKNRKKRTYGYSKEIMRALTAQEPYPEKKIMATIITRHGSAPQGLGTKMLIYRDGRCVDDRRRKYGSKSHPDCQTYGSRRGRTGKDLPCRHVRK